MIEEPLPPTEPPKGEPPDRPRTERLYDASGKVVERPIEKPSEAKPSDEVSPPPSPIVLPEAGFFDRLLGRKPKLPPAKKLEDVAGPPPAPPSYVLFRFAEPDSTAMIYDRKNVSPFQLAMLAKTLEVIATEEIRRWHIDVVNKQAKARAKTKEEESRYRGKRNGGAA